MPNKKVAVVVQRYGVEALGGSESLARDIAESLSGAFEVDVLTTCAKDYTTWENYFPPGDRKDGKATIKRFRVDQKRGAFFKIFNLFMHVILSMGLGMPLAIEKLWMRMLGPYSARLFDYIKNNSASYDAFIFVTYLYATSYYGSLLVPDKAVLVPTAHDEPYIRFKIFREAFTSVGKIIYLTDEERSFVDGLFGLPPDKGVVIGAGVKDVSLSSGDFRERYGIKGDFLLYVGRLDIMKGVGKLLEYFERYSRKHDNGLKLVLCGTGPMRVPARDRVVPLGYVPDEDKYGAIREAIAVVQPSYYESFSFSLMESMLCGTPAIVNGECDVLRGHSEKSGGGISYRSYEEFERAVDTLYGDRSLRKRMGEAGKNYVANNYSNNIIANLYILTINSLISDREKHYEMSVNGPLSAL